MQKNDSSEEKAESCPVCDLVLDSEVSSLAVSPLCAMNSLWA